MANRHFDTLFPIIVIVGISLGAAWVLFKGLGSTGSYESGVAQLGGAAAGFMAVFTALVVWYNRLDSRRSEELTVEIGRLLAATIVREGKDDIAALDTIYADLRDSFDDSFRRQSRSWRELLVKEMRRESIRQVKLQYPNLKDWQPGEAQLETVVETSTETKE